jgi:stearoyl-CoA desaturase (delta-9 desaturase)
MATPLPPSFTVPATATETRRDPLLHGELPPLLEGGLTVKNVWKNLDWKHVLGLGLTPLIAIYGLLTTEIQTKTLIWSIIYYFATGLGITAGKKDDTYSRTNKKDVVISNKLQCTHLFDCIT